jgi:hypothetical protein
MNYKRPSCIKSTGTGQSALNRTAGGIGRFGGRFREFGTLQAKSATTEDKTFSVCLLDLTGILESTNLLHAPILVVHYPFSFRSPAFAPLSGSKSVDRLRIARQNSKGIVWHSNANSFVRTQSGRRLLVVGHGILCSKPDCNEVSTGMAAVQDVQKATSELLLMPDWDLNLRVGYFVQ